jgi:hypothetical protein
MDVQTDSAALSLNVQNLPVAGIAGVALLLALLGTAGVSKTRKK